MADNFVMNDVHIAGYADTLEKKLKKQDEIFNEYLEILNEIKSTSVKSGEVHDVLEQLYNEAKNIYDHSADRGENIKKCLYTFISRIDDIDLKIYGD